MAILSPHSLTLGDIIKERVLFSCQNQESSLATRSQFAIVVMLAVQSWIVDYKFVTLRWYKNPYFRPHLQSTYKIVGRLQNSFRSFMVVWL